MTADEIDALVVSVLCGRAADEHWGAPTSGAAGGTGSDLAVATHLVACKHACYGLGGTLAYRGPPSEATALVERNPALLAVCEDDLRRLYETAQALIRENEAVVDALARRLVRSRILSGAEVRAVIGAPERPGARPTPACPTWEAPMDEERMDAAVAEVIVALVNMRRVLDPDAFLALVGSIMVEIDQGAETALERDLRLRPQGNVVPFPGPAARLRTGPDP